MKFIYCPHCRSELSTKDGHPYCESCDWTFYENSKPAAGVLIVKDDKVLLSRRGIDPYKGAIDIVGGFLNNGESPEDGAKREVKEETGLDVELTDFLGFYMEQYGVGGAYVLQMFFIGKILSGEMKPQDDVAELFWVPINEIQSDGGFPSLQQVLDDFKHKYANDQL